MNLGLVGVGGAGGRIVDAIVKAERTTGRTLSKEQPLVFDTDRDALSALSEVAPDRRIPIGNTFDRVEGAGVSGDPDLAADVARTDDYEIQRSFDDVAIEELDGMLIVAGLGGGTGGGAGAVILNMCQELFDLPVYAIGVLPTVGEGDQIARTAARSLQSFVRIADNVFVFDNEQWLEDEGYTRAEANVVLGERMVRLLSLGEFDGRPAEARVDRTDIIRTLAVGGVSSIGTATWTLDLGWRRWVHWLPWVKIPPRDGPQDAMQLKHLVQEAVEADLTLPCSVDSTHRALIVTEGPPEVLSRKGFESARHWLESAIDTVEIIAGDEPRPRSRSVRAIVLLSNVTDVPRIEALKKQGIAASQPADPAAEVED